MSEDTLIYSNRQNTNRYEFIDVAKALLMILTVIGHSGSPFTPYIYLFHLSGFVFFSGFLFKEKTFDLKKNIEKKIKTLYFPYVKYQLIFLFLSTIFSLTYIYKYNPDYYTLRHYVNGIIATLTFGGGGGDLLGAMWFIVLLLEVSILYIVIYYLAVKVFKSNKLLDFIIIFLYIFGMTLNHFQIYLPRYIDTAMIMVIFYQLGFYFNKYKNRIPINIFYFIIALINLYILNQFGKVDIGVHNFTNFCFFLISSLSGIYCIIYVSNTFVKYGISQYFIYIGKNTMTILALHFLSFKLVTYLIIISNSYSFERLSEFPILIDHTNLWFLYSIVGIIIPLLFKYTYNCILSYIKK